MAHEIVCKRLSCAGFRSEKFFFCCRLDSCAKRSEPRNSHSFGKSHSNAMWVHLFFAERNTMVVQLNCVHVLWRVTYLVWKLHFSHREEASSKTSNIRTEPTDLPGTHTTDSPGRCCVLCSTQQQGDGERLAHVCNSQPHAARDVSYCCIETELLQA